MGFLRRRRKDGAATGVTRARLPPLPPAGDPVIDPQTGIPYVDDEDLFDDDRVEEERYVPPIPVVAPVPEVHGLPQDAPEPVGDRDEALRRLEDLRDRGLLSADEHEAQRRRVLGGG